MRGNGRWKEKQRKASHSKKMSGQSRNPFPEPTRRTGPTRHKPRAIPGRHLPSKGKSDLSVSRQPGQDWGGLCVDPPHLPAQSRWRESRERKQRAVSTTVMSRASDGARRSGECFGWTGSATTLALSGRVFSVSGYCVGGCRSPEAARVLAERWGGVPERNRRQPYP